MSDPDVTRPSPAAVENLPAQPPDPGRPGGLYGGENLVPVSVKNQLLDTRDKIAELVAKLNPEFAGAGAASTPLTLPPYLCRLRGPALRHPRWSHSTSSCGRMPADHLAQPGDWARGDALRGAI